MLHSMHRVIPVLAAAILALHAAGAWAADPTQDQLQAQIQALQTKVAALEARQLNAKDVDATVERILQDADRRSQLMAVEGFTAGYTSDRGFVIRDAAGDFLINPYLQFQFRNVTNWTENGKGDDRDSTDNGFEVRRMKFGFQGNAFSPDFTYQFQWAMNRAATTTTRTVTTTDSNGDTASTTVTDTTGSGGSPVMEDAWIRYRFADMWAIRLGQFKDPLFRESLVSSTRQLAADRSLLNNILEGNDNYVQGISLIYDGGARTRAEMAFTDGFNSQNTNFRDPPTNSYDFGVAGRVEHMVLGDPVKGWKQYSGFSAIGNKQDLLVVGAAADWSQTNSSNILFHTVDAQWEPESVSGLSVFGAFVGRYTWLADQPAGADDSFYDWGFLAQAGYLLNNNWEPFVRYDYTRLDNDFAASAIEDNVHEFTVGVNRYFKGHNAKVTLDLTWLPNGSPISADGLGVLPQGDSDNQVIARIQFQLVL